MSTQVIKIRQSASLRGRVAVAGAKNSALRLLAASLLTAEKVTLTQYPAGLLDAQVHVEMLEALGKTTKVAPERIEIDEGRLPDTTLDWTGRSIRNTLLILGALTARRGAGRVPLPGGCKLGERKYDLHVMLLERLGARVWDEGDFLCAEAPAGGLVGADTRIHGTTLEAQAGAWVPGIARQLMKAGLGGAEHICGIPGTLGGLICMNGGSQRKGIGSSIVSVESVDGTGAIHELVADDCDFAYRQSVFQTNGHVITGARLQFATRPRDQIRAEMRGILADRRRKFPRKEPNCGSVFKSNPAMYAEIGPPGAAIEQLGFKGQRIGGALVSPRHANFIVNTGGARAQDVLTLIARIAEAVQAATGYRMKAEAIFVRADGRLQPADTVLEGSS